MYNFLSRLGFACLMSLSFPAFADEAANTPVLLPSPPAVPTPVPDPPSAPHPSPDPGTTSDSTPAARTEVVITVSCSLGGFSNAASPLTIGLFGAAATALLLRRRNRFVSINDT